MIGGLEQRYAALAELRVPQNVLSAAWSPGAVAGLHRWRWHLAMVAAYVSRAYHVRHSEADCPRCAAWNGSAAR